jgi:tol-pal system protein YbgF
MHRPYQTSLLLAGAISAALMASGLVGCAGGKDAADKQIDALQAEISRMQQDQDRINERLGGVESRQDKLERGPTGEGTAAAAGSERPPLQVVVLRPDTEGGGDPDPRDAVDNDAPRTTVRAEGDPGRSGRRAKGDGGAKGDADREYRDALELERKQHHHRAIEAFTGFLVRYPDHPRADNALFWMGEAYLGSGDDARALEQFEAVLARFPDGNKAPDALLKIAQVQKKRGDRGKAREALERLRKRFPNSDAARRAPKE